MSLSHLDRFDRWEAVEGTLGEEVTFPRLEELSIIWCKSLRALSKGQLITQPLPKGSLAEESFGGAETMCRRSAFPALRKLRLSVLGTLEGTPGDEVIFPLLEDLSIDGCPKFTDLPEAPKLSKLAIEGSIFIEGNNQKISLQAASRYFPSLSSLSLAVSPDDTETTLQHVKQEWNHKVLPLVAMMLTRCDVLFSSHSSSVN